MKFKELCENQEKIYDKNPYQIAQYFLEKYKDKALDNINNFISKERNDPDFEIERLSHAREIIKEKLGIKKSMTKFKYKGK